VRPSHSSDNRGRSRVPSPVSQDLALIAREVRCYEITTGAPKVVDAIREILTDVDLAIGIGDLVDDSVADSVLAQHDSVWNPVRAALAVGAAAVEDVCAIRTVSVTAIKAFKLVSTLQMVVPRVAAVSRAALTIAIHVTECGRSCLAALEIQ
jgi:hypothetical protein